MTTADRQMSELARELYGRAVNEMLDGDFGYAADLIIRATRTLSYCGQENAGVEAANWRTHVAENITAPTFEEDDE